MKILRTPNLKKSVSARTTGKWTRAAKRNLIPGYGKRGTGILKNPKKTVYNRGYYRATKGVLPIKLKYSKRKNLINGWGIIIVFIVCGIASCAGNNESETGKTAYDTEVSYYDSETEEKLIEDQKIYSMKRYVGTKSTLRDAPECFGLDNFLYNYNKIAKYGLDKSEIKDLQSHKSEETMYSRLTNYPLTKNCYMTATDSSLCGYEVMVFISFDNSMESSVQTQIIRDCIHAIDRKVSNKWINYEISCIEDKGSTTAYFNELFLFEGKLETNNTISFVIRYNPVSLISEDNWDYNNYKIPNYE